MTKKKWKNTKTTRQQRRKQERADADAMMTRQVEINEELPPRKARRAYAAAHQRRVRRQMRSYRKSMMAARRQMHAAEQFNAATKAAADDAS